MASAVEQLVGNYGTSSPVSFEDFYNAYGRDTDKVGWTEHNPYSFGGSWQNFWAGTRSGAEKAYENYLAEYEFRKNQKATSAQNELTWAREDSQVQRLMEDYKKAGLNPYMILNNGNLSSGAVSSQAAAPNYKRSKSSKSSKDANAEKVVNSAIRAIAMVAMLASM